MGHKKAKSWDFLNLENCWGYASPQHPRLILDPPVSPAFVTVEDTQPLVKCVHSLRCGTKLPISPTEIRVQIAVLFQMHSFEIYLRSAALAPGPRFTKRTYSKNGAGCPEHGVTSPKCGVITSYLGVDHAIFGVNNSIFLEGR